MDIEEVWLHECFKKQNEQQKDDDAGTYLGVMMLGPTWESMGLDFGVCCQVETSVAGQ